MKLVFLMWIIGAILSSCNMGTVVGNGHKPPRDETGEKQEETYQHGPNVPEGSEGARIPSELEVIFATCASSIAGMAIGDNKFKVTHFTEEPSKIHKALFVRTGDHIVVQFDENYYGSFHAKSSWQLNKVDPTAVSEAKAPLCVGEVEEIGPVTEDAINFIEWRVILERPEETFRWQVSWFQRVDAANRIDSIRVGHIQDGNMMPIYELIREE